MKQHLDQYYTKTSIIHRCVDIIHQSIDLDNYIYVDSSCGNNYFAHCLGIPHYSIDLQLPKHVFINKTTNLVLQQDFLSWKGKQISGGSKLIMGFNPPYGERNNLTKQFIHKMTLFSPDYLALILLKPSSRNTWKIGGYTPMHVLDLPANSFYVSQDIPSQFILFRRNNFPISYPMITKTKPVKYNGNLDLCISRTYTTKIRKWCSIAVRYCGVNAGNHYYIYHHNQLYFINFQKELSIVSLNTPKHKLYNSMVFTIINFTHNYTLLSLIKIVQKLFRHSQNCIDKSVLRYNYNTRDVICCMNKL
jgi:hypothetical protein